MKRTFLNSDRPLITCMVQAETPDRIKELVDKSIIDGAEAFGMQFERLKKEYRTPEVYRELFDYTKSRPVYITNYRSLNNEGKTDEMLALELLEYADCGATLCDVMGDIYDKQPDELATDKVAIEKQVKLIEKLHEKGTEVLMSSHVLKFTPAERVLEIALEHKRRGADISKIVTYAENMEQQLENLRIINMLKENLGIPFLFLCGGQCSVLRRIGGELGCCMYLGVYEHDEFATTVQPLVKSIKKVRMGMENEF